MRKMDSEGQPFENIISQNLFYVDKTAFIKTWFEDAYFVILITRPRRSGKTMTLDMMRCFFSTEYQGRSDLFQGLEIARSPEMMAIQGTVPTISLTLGGIKATSFEAFLASFHVVLAGLYARFRYLTEGGKMSEQDKKTFEQVADKARFVPVRDANPGRYEAFVLECESALAWLSEWLYGYYGKKVYILIDDYDTPIHYAYQNGYHKEAMDVLRSLLGRTLKYNDYLHRAIVMGADPMGMESLDIDYLKVSSFLEGPYQDVFDLPSFPYRADRQRDEAGRTG